jgi:hypothetical protein
MQYQQQVNICGGRQGCHVHYSHALSLFTGFPNMNAVALEDATGETYVSTPDFLKVGLASSAVAWTVIVSVGYVIMYGISY